MRLGTVSTVILVWCAAIGAAGILSSCGGSPCEKWHVTSVFKRGELVRHTPSREVVRVLGYSRYRQYRQEKCGGFPATTYQVRFADGAETHVKLEYLEPTP